MVRAAYYRGILKNILDNGLHTMTDELISLSSLGEATNENTMKIKPKLVVECYAKILEGNK